MLFTRFAGRSAVDATGQRATIFDLAVDLAAGDYPPVTQLLIRGKGKTICALPWPEDAQPSGDLPVPTLADAVPVPPDALEQRVLLRRDILDALLLDIAQQRAVRANDLWLRADAGGYVLAGADVSPWAVLRRLSHGLLQAPVADRMLDWRSIEFLRGDPRAAAAGRDYHRVVTHLTAPQIAGLAAAIPYPHAAELLAMIPAPLAAKTLERMSPERQTQVLTVLAPAQATAIVAELPSDVAADALGQLEIADATRLLENLPPRRSHAVQELLRYAPDCAGGIMTADFVVAPVAGTVGEVLDSIRQQLPLPDFAYYIYLVDDEQQRHLRGVASLRDLIVADPEAPVQSVMVRDPFAVSPLTSALDVAEQITQQDINAVPVVSATDQLLGIITVDAAMAVITPAAWRDNMPRVFS